MREARPNTARSVEHYQNSTYKVDFDRSNHDEEPQVRWNPHGQVVQVNLKAQDQEPEKPVSENCIRYLSSTSDYSTNMTAVFNAWLNSR